MLKGLDVESGETVAVKQVRLKHLRKGRLEQLQTEIKMLKKLKHPYIVKYIDSFSSEQHLNIILEYIENGSLVEQLNKFGAFQEHLVAL